MRTISLGQGSAAIAAVAAATLAAAWGFELIGGYEPCPLCLEQRVPYYVGIPLALIAALAAARVPRRIVARIALGAVALIFAYGAYLGGYQAGAEWGWWPGPADCAAGGGGATRDAGDLLGQLRETRVVRCDEASWRFAGLSFAGWNFAISAGLAAAAAILALGPAYGSSSASQ